MTTESLEELRERLLRKESVQQMIQVRAYEIYQMRGGKPGGEAQDWFHAESEVLAFLIASESAHSEEQGTESPGAASASNVPTEAAARKPKPRARAKSREGKPAAAKKTAPKRAATTKPAESKSKAKKAGKPSKAEESVE